MKISKNMTNVEIAELLRDVAAAYKIKDADRNKFRIVAYERAADAVEHLSSEAKDLWDDGKLTDVAGIGESIAKHLDEIFRTGKSKHFSVVMKGLAESMFELMKVAGIGPKTALKMAKSGEVPSEVKKSLRELKKNPQRLLLPYAQEIADGIVAWLEKDKNVTRADALGSLRRKASTVGDVDIAAASTNAAETINHFTKYPNATRILEKGDRTASIIVPGNKQVDLMVEIPDAYGALLQHFTGSKHHNIALRELALKKGMSLSDYGIKIKGKLEKVKTEEDLYKRLGLDYISPELREDTGEIDAARSNKLPNLIELTDIKADLQIHSSFDIETSHDVGISSMEEVVRKAEELNYEYVAFTEHNPSKSKHNEKEIVAILKRKQRKVVKLKSSVKAFNGLEIDILPDGSLPVPDEGLQTLDFALVSIHSSFSQSRDAMTKRVLSGLAHPKVKIFAHPTARRLNWRESIELNWPEIFDFCVKHNKWLEINADPVRLDLPDNLVRDAVSKGVKLTLGTDSHGITQMANMKYGVDVARRGWATKGDIINSLSLSEFKEVIKK